jgi:M6 family metalloprotease-like protein
LRRNERLKKHSEVRKLLLSDEDREKFSPTQPSPASADPTAGQVLPFGGAMVQPDIIGTYVGITIAVDFSDEVGTMPIDSIEDFINKIGYTGNGNNGSVHDYFFDVSGGKVDYQSIVAGYYRARNPKTYYDSRNASFGQRAIELIREAFEWLENDGFDFSVLSVDGGNRVLVVNILYAGSPTQGWSQGLWPHMGSVRLTVDGTYNIRRYQISSLGSEPSGWGGSGGGLGIGTVCHENGHMLCGWPDLYDYGYESNGVGGFCIMCGSGAKNPVPPCAYLRDDAGWEAVTDITDMADGTVFTHIPNTTTSFVYRNRSNSREMFYVESRLKEGRNATLPDEGFLIWHVDMDGSNDYESMTARSHYLVSLEQADNAFELEAGRNSGRSGDCFRGGYKDRFDDATAPDAHWWSGSNSGMKIWNMSEIGDTMSFSIGEKAETSYDLEINAGEHGRASPSGRVSVGAGSSISIAIEADSGYQIYEIKVNETATGIVDTLTIENINEHMTVAVLFGLKSGLTVLQPQKGEIYYVGDTVSISWRNRGIDIVAYDIAYSIDKGATFTPIATGVSAGDSAYSWIVPSLESESCFIKVADSDGTPSVMSDLFSIRKKPNISIDSTIFTIMVDEGTNREQTLGIKNIGTGNLAINAATLQQINRVKISELSIGTSDDTEPDGIEIWNSGGDIDLSGWQVIWEDNTPAMSGGYTFEEGFILKAGAVFVIDENEGDITDSTAFFGTSVQWLFSNPLIISVTLLDRSGRGVDFVKTTDSPIMPPEGTDWLGDGIDACDSYVYRVNTTDRDSAGDWECASMGSMKKINASNWVPTPPHVTISPLTKTISEGATAAITIAVDATDLALGDYPDTLIIYHNDPDKPSPILIPCMVSVVPFGTGVTTDRTDRSSRKIEGQEPTFIAAPNPVSPGQNVFFKYLPRGDERSGELFIYNGVGDCLFKDKIDFTGVSVFNRQPVRFSWLPRDGHGRIYRQGTCLARLVVKRNNETKSVFSTKVGLR